MVLELIAIKKNGKYFVRHKSDSYFEVGRLVFDMKTAESFDRSWLTFETLPMTVGEQVPGRQVIVQYRLKEGFISSPKTPSLMPLDTFEALPGDEDERIKNSDIRGLYQAEYETHPSTYRNIEFKIEVIDEDCEPLIKPKYPFKSEFPYYIENHSAVKHNYPCYISPEELFVIVKEWIPKNLPKNCVISSYYNFHIQVDLRVPLLHDEMHKVEVSGARAKRVRYAEKPLRTIPYTVINVCTPGNKYGPVIEEIRANNYYELEAQIDGLLQSYADAMNAQLVVCPHCKGYGFQSQPAPAGVVAGGVGK